MKKILSAFIVCVLLVLTPQLRANQRCMGFVKPTTIVEAAQPETINMKMATYQFAI